MKRILIIALVLILVFLGISYFYIKGTPRYSLYQMRKAIEDKDVETALKYLDIDSIVDNMMQELIAKEGPPPENEWEAMGRNIGKGMMMLMLPTMKETLKSTIKTAIISADDKSKISGLRSGSIWDFNIITQGKTAFISPKNDDSIKFKMVKTKDRYWKIIQIIDTKNNPPLREGDG